ncbi:MAG: hypothetical protein LLG02_11215 [Pelosinus sp.]|nr:hypothetical protein [Pelosinus sp.]
MEKFLQGFTEMLDTVTDVTMDTCLDDLDEWDSLSIVSFAAMSDIEYGKKLVADDIRTAKTVHDLYNLIFVE